MKKFFIFILFLIGLINSEFPSIRFLLTYNKIQELNNIILYEILKENFLKFSFDLNNFNFTQKVDFVGTVQMNFTNLTLKFDNFDNETITAQYLEDKKIKLNINGINASLLTNYSFLSNFYQRDFGEGVIKLDNFSFEIIYTIVHYQNNIDPSKYGPGILISNCSIEDFQLNFKFIPVEGPLEKLFEYVLNNFKTLLLDYLRSHFNTIINQTNINIENYMTNKTLQINFNNTRFLNFSMNEEPIINENNFSFALELAYFTNNYTYPGKTINIPPIDKNYAFNMIISQYLLNSALYSLSKEGFLNRKIDSDKNFLKVETFKNIFPNLTEEFNDTQLIDLVLYPFDSPTVNLTEEKEKGFLLTIMHTVEMYVRNESETDDELVVKGNYTFEINVPYFNIKKKSFNSTIKSIILTDFKCDETETKIDVDEDLAKTEINKLIESKKNLLILLYKFALQTFKVNNFENLKNLIVEPNDNYVYIGLTDEDITQYFKK